MRTPVEVAATLRHSVGQVVRGKPAEIDLALTTLLAGGHLLVEDLPGTGKTLLAKSLAAALGGTFGRVQCTPDLLPTDITGTSIFRPDGGEWEFRAGPVFANVVLVDEVNRASPRTQAALLEPMEERQVTVDGRTWRLPDPFFLVATQNPHGQVGTFPLPESQLDRFAVVMNMGLPGRDAEREIVTGVGGTAALEQAAPASSPDEVAATVAAVGALHCDPAVVEYLLDLVDATRVHPHLGQGASPRAAGALMQLSRARAVVAGRNYVTPDDVQATFVPALAHRVTVGDRVDTAVARGVLAGMLATVPVPRPPV